MNLDHDLRRALKRTDPPGGFDHRVLSRIAAGDTVRLAAPQSRWTRAVLPLAASLILAFGATYYMQQRQERHARDAQVQAERAAREVVFALRVASETVAEAQTKVQELTQHEH
jgi:hypothetical protein